MEEHIKQIEEKVAVVTDSLDAQTQVDEGIVERAQVAKKAIADASQALEDNEYELVLTLANGSNEILKMLYGAVDKIENNDEGVIEGVADSVEEEMVENSTSTAEVIGPIATTTEIQVNQVNQVNQVEEVEEEEEVSEEFEVKIQ